MASSELMIDSSFEGDFPARNSLLPNRWESLHYRQLYKWSGGPTKDDHCWHELIEFRELPEQPAESVAMTATEFVKRFADVKGWDEDLSPHFWPDSHL